MIFLLSQDPFMAIQLNSNDFWKGKVTDFIVLVPSSTNSVIIIHLKIQPMLSSIKQIIYVNGLITQFLLFCSSCFIIKRQLLSQYQSSLGFCIFYSFQMETSMRRQIQKIACIRVIDTSQLFEEALGDIFSEKYLQQHRKQFSDRLFIFQITTTQKTWSLFKENKDLERFFSDQVVKKKLSLHTQQGLNKIKDLTGEREGQVYQDALSQLCTINPQNIQLPFFECTKDAYYSFKMRKRSGGRYRQASCCKMGAIFKPWKEREVSIYLKGVGYFNQSGQIREFLSFSQGFHFQFGRPSTGKQFGVVLFANHRKLSLQAANIRDFIYFMFILRRACEQSCYMSLNRYNSFAPIRYSNSAKFLVDGEQYFQAVASSIQQAKVSILITGWMLNPQFLMRRGGNKITLQQLIVNAAEKGVKISIILYYQSCFLTNDSLHAKQQLQGKSDNIRVLRHPCGKLPNLWSHHGKIVIIDQIQGFVGGMDLCYGRYDDHEHQVFASEQDYPGIQYNNIRKNDQLDVRNPKNESIPRSECRLAWHDIGQSVIGEVVTDLVHHFYQMWNFIRYQNCINPQDSYPPSLFEVDNKSIFSMKVVPKQESQISQSNIFQRIQNGFNNLKQKGLNAMEKVKNQINKLTKEEKQQKQNQSKIRIRHSANGEYFQKYFKQINHQIQKKKKNQEKQMKRIQNKGSNSTRRNSKSKRFSADQVNQIKESFVVDQIKEDGLRKTNSFLLTGDKIIDFMSLQIGDDYVQCLQKIKLKIPQDTQQSVIIQQKQVDSDQQKTVTKLWQYQCNNIGTKNVGRDQCQVMRSVGNWSIGCHPSNNQFSIHIAYIQLISQAKHYIYIQNQFFISSMADSNIVKNQIAYALYLRIVKAIQQNQSFRVYIMLPLLPGFSGDLEAEQCLLLRRQMQWQYDTICRGSDSLWKKLLSHTNDPSKYIQFLSLRNHGRAEWSSTPKTQIVYIHSKLMIIDDDTVVCGSANINDRSMLGNRDSQIAVVTRGQDFVEGMMNEQQFVVSQVAHELRLKLWHEHFGFQQKDMIDPICKATWEMIAERALSNTQLYRQIFGCYPDDTMTTRRKIEEVRSNSNLQLYDKLNKRIIGNVVQFPLNFLCDEQLTCLITQKQFYMPTECLT